MRKLFVTFSVPLETGPVQGDCLLLAPDDWDCDAAFIYDMKRQIDSMFAATLAEEHKDLKVAGKASLLNVIQLESPTPRPRTPSQSIWHPPVRSPKIRTRSDLPF